MSEKTPPVESAGTDPVNDDQSGAPVAPAIQKALEDLGASYVVVPCDPDLSESAAFAAAYGYRQEQVANTVIVKVRGGGDVSHAACMALSSTRLDLNHRLKQHLGVRKISFAPSEETTALTGMEIGSVGPVGLPDDLPLYVDLRVLSLPWVIVGSGFRRSKVRLDTPVLRELPGVELLADLALELDRA